MPSPQALKEITVGDILGRNEKEKDDVGVRGAILNYSRQNPDGVTVRMASESLGIDYHRAYVIMKELVSSRELYSRKVGGIKNDLYYPNGKMIHKYLQESKDFGDQTFRVSFHEGKKGPRIQIQERRYTLLEGEKVEGTIFLEVSHAEDIIQLFQDMYTKFMLAEKTKSSMDVNE